MKSTVCASAPTITLSDGDAVTISDLATHRRATITVADAEAAYAADIHERYGQATTWWGQLAVLAEAARYDKAHPDQPSLAAELYGRGLEVAA